jgi:hypothetical protein
LRAEDTRGIGQISGHITENRGGRQVQRRPVTPAVDGGTATQANPQPSRVLKILEQQTQAPTGRDQGIAAIEPSQPDDQRALDGHGAVGQSQNWHRSHAIEGIRRGQEFEGAPQGMVQAFEKTITTVAEREQAVAGRCQVPSRCKRAHGSFESRGCDEAHGTRI